MPDAMCRLFACIAEHTRGEHKGFLAIVTNYIVTSRTLY